MKIIDVVQGTPEWIAARRGIPTASSFDKIVTTKGERSKQRDKYLCQLVGEVLSGQSEETYQNGAMQRGVELESEARTLYELISGLEVKQVGFCLSGSYGCSPDGVVAENGLLELKSPSVATHIGYLLDGKLPSEYFQQVHGQLLVTGREWCDFMSYYPGIKPFIIRVTRDEQFIEKLKAELEAFCADLQSTVEQLREG